MSNFKKIIIFFSFLLLAFTAQQLNLNLVFDNLTSHGRIKGVSQDFDGQLKVLFFDLGEADSTFIETPQHKQILIDGGEDKSVLEKLSYAMNWNDDYIDLVIATHPHADHLGGLVSVLKKYRVGQVWLTGVAYSSAHYLEFLNLLKEKNISTRLVYSCRSSQRDNTFFKLSLAGLETLPKTHCLDELEISPQINLKVLYPLENLNGKKIKNVNNSSVVVKLNYQQISFLFMGDAETPSEQKILKAFSPQELKADVLKVAHQGSSDASSQAFLQAVRPRYAVIFVGRDNPYGHPSLRIIRRLQRLGIKVLRTDMSGDIGFVSDGYHLIRLK